MPIESPEQNQYSFLEEPIRLNADLILEDSDIEASLSEKEMKEFGKKTLFWRSKINFPTYHLNPETRLLLISDYEKRSHVGYWLKENSKLLQAFKNKYLSK